MKARILDSSYVLDFTDKGFNSGEIRDTITKETNEVLQCFTSEALKDWEVHFIFRYNNTNKILIYLVAGSYPKEKYKEITIHIPIPTNDLVVWGVGEDQHVYPKNHLDNKIKNFRCLDVQFSEFDNRENYILDCMRRAIDFCFKEGFTVSGIRVKIV